MDADLTVPDGDPAKDIKAFSKVRGTSRNGLIVFSRLVTH
jgi:imidazolonepropionase-like amidohydrolase